MTWGDGAAGRHGRPNAPHRFDPAPAVPPATHPALVKDERLAAAETDPDLPVITGEAGTCASCGAGPGFRAHQPAWWRFLHPLSTWR